MPIHQQKKRYIINDKRPSKSKDDETKMKMDLIPSDGRPKTVQRHHMALLETYLQWLKTLGFAPQTCYDYGLFVRYFLDWLYRQQGMGHITQLRRKHVMEYFQFLECKISPRTGRALSTSHLNRTFLSVDKFLECLQQYGMEGVPSPPKYSVTRLRTRPLVVLTREEVSALYDAIDLTFLDYSCEVRTVRQMTLRLILDLCYGCGLRKAEALKVEIADVNFDRRVLHVRQGKNNQDRYVPMSDGITASIETYAYHYRRCIVEKKKRSKKLYPFGEVAMAKSMVTLVKCTKNEDLKMKKPTLHTLRHSIATHLMQNGMDIYRIALFLGHRSLESTQIYTHLIHEL